MSADFWSSEYQAIIFLWLYDGRKVCAFPSWSVQLLFFKHHACTLEKKTTHFLKVVFIASNQQELLFQRLATETMLK